MNQEQLAVAVIGAGELGKEVLEILTQCRRAKIVGISDTDPVVAQQAASTFSVRPYSDNRLILTSTNPQVAFLCVPPQATTEIIPTCVRRGINVWKRLPVARSLAEGAGLVRPMLKANLKFVVGTQRRFAGGYETAWRWRKRLNQVFLAQAHYLFNWGGGLGWHGDKSAAGGGALMEIAYHPIDLLVWMLGLPEEVYAVSATGANAGKTIHGTRQPVYDTDDTAAAILKYRSGVMASVVTTRCSGPVSEELRLHGQEGSITASAESCSLRGPDGETLDHYASPHVALGPMRAQIEAFLESVATNASHYHCSALENLLDLVVIETAYLSNRTSQPEHPARLLQNHGLSVDQCLSLRPVVDL